MSGLLGAALGHGQAFAERSQAEAESRAIADRLERVFERFGQVDASDAREKGGTGLGFAICRMVVAQHGGRIWAERGALRGTVISVELPAR